MEKQNTNEERRFNNETPPPPSSPRQLLPTTAMNNNNSQKTKETFLTAGTTISTPTTATVTGGNNKTANTTKTNNSNNNYNNGNSSTTNIRTTNNIRTYHMQQQQQIKAANDASTGSLLRSLELRFQIENELVHVVDKLRTLHDRHTSEEFYRKIHELEKYKLTVQTLKEKLIKYESKNTINLRKIADLEQDKAGQLVEIMKLRESALDNSQTDHEERAILLQEKDEEIEALNEHLKEVESNLSQAKTHVREYRERCEKAEVQMHQAIDGMKTVETSAQLHQDKNVEHVNKLEGRLADAEEYRSSVNARLGQMEDEVSTLNSTILKLKGELNRSTILLEEEQKKSNSFEEKLNQANETVEAMYSSSREQRSDEVKSREELDTMKRELAKLKTRDKARFNEGALQVANVENDRLRNSLVEGQKQIDMLEQQNIQLTRKLADQVALVERTKAEMAAAQNDARQRVERLENNIRVLCQNIESSNSILSMRSKKKEEPKRVESKADMVRREMEEWQNNHQNNDNAENNNNNIVQQQQNNNNTIEQEAVPSSRSNNFDDSDLVNEDDLKYLLASSVHSRGGNSQKIYNNNNKKERKKKKDDKMSPYLQNKTPVNRRNSNHNKKVGTPTNKGSRSRSSFVDEIRGNVSSSSGGGNKKGK